MLLLSLLSGAITMIIRMGNYEALGPERQFIVVIQIGAIAVGYLLMWISLRPGLAALIPVVAAALKWYLLTSGRFVIVNHPYYLMSVGGAVIASLYVLGKCQDQRVIVSTCLWAMASI